MKANGKWAIDVQKQVDDVLKWSDYRSGAVAQMYSIFHKYFNLGMLYQKEKARAKHRTTTAVRKPSTASVHA